jgi:hypothetical protein
MGIGKRLLNKGHSMTIQTDIHYEVTDTFGGESNYSWVKRGKVKCKPGEEYTNLAAVRRVKRAIGWNGVKCRVESDGDTITLYPRGVHQVCFISFHSWGNASS